MSSNHNQDDGIKLKCNLCKYPHYTQELWLRHIGHRDFLVCKRHLTPEQRRRIKHEAEKSDAQRVG